MREYLRCRWRMISHFAQNGSRKRMMLCVRASIDGTCALPESCRRLHCVLARAEQRLVRIRVRHVRVDGRYQPVQIAWLQVRPCPWTLTSPRVNVCEPILLLVVLDRDNRCNNLMVHRCTYELISSHQPTDTHRLCPSLLAGAALSCRIRQGRHHGVVIGFG